MSVKDHNSPKSGKNSPVAAEPFAAGADHHDGHPNHHEGHHTHLRHHDGHHQHDEHEDLCERSGIGQSLGNVSFSQSMVLAPERVSISASNVLPTMVEPTAAEDFTIEEVRAQYHQHEMQHETPKISTGRNNSFDRPPAVDDDDGGNTVDNNSRNYEQEELAPVAQTLSIYPPEVITLARQMRGLDQHQFLMLAELTQQRAWTNVYSLVGFRGTAWYLPALRPLEEDEPSCGVGFNRAAGLWIAMCGWKLEINVVGYLVRIAVIVAFWLAMWANFPDNHIELGGKFFDPVAAILFSTITGGILSRLLRIPPLICVLWMAIMWSNVPTVGYFTSGIDKYVRKAALSFGLSVILIRAGLYIKPAEVKPMMLLYLGFTFLPAIAELLAHSFVAKELFNYPDYNWAFTQGAVASVVSPAVVVPALLSLKLDGYGLTRGPSALMMPASPAEMVAGIWNINFMTQLTLNTGETPLWLLILLGPLQIIGGVVLGVILGCLHYLALKVLLAEAHKLPTKTYTSEHTKGVAQLSTAIMAVVGVATLAYTKELHLAGGGAVAVTVMAMTAGVLINRRAYGGAPHYGEQFKLLCLNSAELWDVFTMPVLFTMVGTAIDLGQVFTSEFFPKMLACLAVGVAARAIVAVAITGRQDWDMGERAVMAIGWCGKASVQAAVGRAALDRAREIFDEVATTKGVAQAQQNLELATQVANAAVVMILVCAPIAALTLVRVGPFFMRKEALPAPPGSPV